MLFIKQLNCLCVSEVSTKRPAYEEELKTHHYLVPHMHCLIDYNVFTVPVKKVKYFCAH